MDQAIIGIAFKYDGYGMALFVLITTLVSAFLSSFIGLERELRGQAAGLRTHVLLAVGCSLMMTLSIYAIKIAVYGTFDNTTPFTYDTSRIAAGVVGGIGFLCAGTIIKNGVTVRGLTTAATLWLCGGVGLACGAGFVLEAIITTAVSLFFLLGLVKIEKMMDKHSPQVRLIVAPDVAILNDIHSQADTNRLIIKNIVSDTIVDESGRKAVDITIFFAYQSDTAAVNDFCESFNGNPKIYQVKSSKFSRRS
jgi:putative Mg2+ transporter-C (MgtC) family protein